MRMFVRDIAVMTGLMTGTGLIALLITGMLPLSGYPVWVLVALVILVLAAGALSVPNYLGVASRIQPVPVPKLVTVGDSIFVRRFPSRSFDSVRGSLIQVR